MTDRQAADIGSVQAPERAEEPPGNAPAAASGATGRRARAVAVWAVLFAVAVAAFGLPTDPVYAFVWLWALAIAWRFGQPWRTHFRFARDWVPVVVLLTLYNFSRGFADGVRAPHVHELIDADKWMFGWLTGGKIPTVWLQERLYDPHQVQWWEALVTLTYFSHFVASLGAGITLWLVSRQRWAQYMRRWFVLGLAGLATYFLYPAAPPWWASVHGVLTDPVLRVSLRGGKELGLHGAFSVVRMGQAASNQVAAMPSLHSAYALMVVLFFARLVRKRYWPLLALYPLAMTFSLVYSGEHYVIDVLVGWTYVVVSFVLVWLGERWWASRKAAREAAGEASREPVSAA